MAHATTTVAGVLGRAAGLQHEKLLSRLPPAAAGDSNAIHRARVASRREREALALAAVVAPNGASARVGRDVRRVTRALGPVREIDVALEELDHVAARRAWPADRVAAVKRHLETTRDQRRAQMRTKIAAVDVNRLVERSEAALDAAVAATTDREWRRALAARVAERARRASAAVTRCGTLYAPDRLHALRIAVKKLRYTLELADGVVPRIGDLLDGLKHAQGRFGHLHDVQILLGEVRAAAVRGRRTAMGAGLQMIAESLERDCREIHARALGELPALTVILSTIRRGVVPALRSGRPSMIKVKLTTASAKRSAELDRRSGHSAGASSR